MAGISAKTPDCGVEPKRPYGYHIPSQSLAAPMPTVSRVGPYRLYFYAADGTEPPHIHVQRDSEMAKFWLTPTELAWNRGFRPPELRRLRGMIAGRRNTLLEKWHGYFRT